MSATAGWALGAPSATAQLQFLVFLVMGVAIGWVLAERPRWSLRCASMIVMAVCGAWLGAEFAHLFGQAETGGRHQLAAAAIGAAALAYLWRRWHRRPQRGSDGDIALEPPHA